ncbi:MAG: hypothetical protein WB460_21735 [Candidatus Acidiferrales bacterium]
MLKKSAFILLLILILCLAAESGAQEPTPETKRVHWHKYVSKEYGFSVKYPDPYRRIADPGFCEGNSYRRYLLCLARRDDPDSKFFVTLVIEGPFAIKTTRGDNEYTPQKIGQHLFYCGLGGSMAVGFSDECTFDLNDKTLEFNVSPAQPTDPTGKINPLMFETLKTFRVL